MMVFTILVFRIGLSLTMKQHYNFENKNECHYMFNPAIWKYTFKVKK